MSVPKLARQLIGLVRAEADREVLLAKADELEQLMTEEARGREAMRSQRFHAQRVYR